LIDELTLSTIIVYTNISVFAVAHSRIENHGHFTDASNRDAGLWRREKSALAGLAAAAFLIRTRIWRFNCRNVRLP